MKTTIAIFAALVSWGSVGSASAKLVDIGDVSLKVAATIEANIPAAKLGDISINEVSNGNRYLVKLKVKGEDKVTLRISKSGELLKASQDIKTKALPKRVRNAVEDFLGELGSIVDVDRLTKGSQVSYVVTVDVGDGTTTKIILSQNGTIIQAEQDIDVQDLSKKLRKAVNALIEDGEALVSLSRNVDDGNLTYILVVENEETSVQTTLTLDRNGKVIDEEED
jgi:hypothetical protein